MTLSYMCNAALFPPSTPQRRCQALVVWLCSFRLGRLQLSEVLDKHLVHLFVFYSELSNSLSRPNQLKYITSGTMTLPSSSAAPTPLRRFAFHSTTTCATQASEYGKCILKNYTDVRKDACKEEFAKFGACLRTAVSTLRS